MRALLLVFLVACTDSGGPNGLVIDADLQAMQCDGAPCTHVNIGVRREGGSVGDTSAWLSVDGEPAIEVPADGKLVLPGWVTRAHIEATDGEDSVIVEGANRLTSPFEMAATLPATVTVGSIPELTWRAQGGSVEATTVFATKVPAQRFGFVETFGKDDGRVALANIFTHEGEYTISLYRELNERGILWVSNWQTRVFAVTAPQ